MHNLSFPMKRLILLLLPLAFALGGCLSIKTHHTVDPIQINEVHELIKSLATQRKQTIILSTHILPEITSIYQQVLMISHKKIVTNSPIEQLVAKHQLPLDQVFIKLAVA